MDHRTFTGRVAATVPGRLVLVLSWAPGELESSAAAIPRAEALAHRAAAMAIELGCAIGRPVWRAQVGAGLYNETDGGHRIPVALVLSSNDPGEVNAARLVLRQVLADLSTLGGKAQQLRRTCDVCMLRPSCAFVDLAGQSYAACESCLNTCPLS